MADEWSLFARALKCSVMESSFCFANVEFITVPASSFIVDFGPLRSVQAIFVWKKGFDAACVLENDLEFSPRLTAKNNTNEFLNFLNSRHDIIKFTIEFEQDNRILFSDILLKRCPDNTFSTSVYRKKAFTGLYNKWDSFTPCKYKINLIRTLTYRCFRICPSPALLQAAIKDLRKLLLQNGYPQGVITFNINDVLNKKKNNQITLFKLQSPKKDILYLGLHSNQVTKRLMKSCVYNFYSFVNLKIIFQNTHRIKSFFPYKDRLNRSQRSKAIYKAGCWNCDEFYIGKTKRRLSHTKTKTQPLLIM